MTKMNASNIDPTNRSAAWMKRAVEVMPGGVNSPVRSYQNVNMTPRFIEKANGAYITDADGNQYIDLINSYGPIILGHAYPEVIEAVEKAAATGLSFGSATGREVEMAEFLCDALPHIEMIRMVNSGTEAVMSAIRAARGYTGRKKIIKFAGCYHGHSDAMLVSAGSGLMTQGIPSSAGVTKGAAQDTLTANYNSLTEVTRFFEQYKDEIACVIVEPVAANMGVVPPKPGFLEGLRKLCNDNDAILIFDEVITGFRLAFGGAAQYFNVMPDLAVYGKVIGAGMPVGAYGGKREIMEQISPCGPVYQAGTLSGNPVAMAAGLAQLRILKAHPEYYKILQERGDQLYETVRNQVLEHQLPIQVNHIGSIGTIFFNENPVVDAEGAQQSNTKQFAAFFRQLIEEGIHVPPSQFEAWFLSMAHTEEIVDQIMNAAMKAVQLATESENR